MTVRYVRSTSTFTDGLSWAGAHTTVAAALAASVGGDVLFVSQAHAESSAISSGLDFVAPGNPVRIICANDGATPPTTLATTAVVNSTVGFAIKGDVFVYGVIFKTTNATTSGWIAVGGGGAGRTVFENCTFWTSATTGSANMWVGSNYSTGAHNRTICRSCNFKFGVAANFVVLGRGVEFYGCVLPDPAGNAIPTVLFPRDTTNAAACGTTTYFYGCDFSAAGSTKSLFSWPQVMDNIYLVNCKWAAAVTPIVSAIPDGGGGEFFFKNSGSANNNYTNKVTKYAGTIDLDTTQYLTLTAEAGANDGDIGYSWKMTSTATVDRFQPLISEWIRMRYTTTGSSRVLTIEILYDDSINLATGEVWVELGAMTDAASPLMAMFSSRVALLDTASTALAAGIGITHWTKGTAATGWQSRKLVSPAFTPQKKGYVMARVCLGRPSYTIYVNPNLVIT